ncbi:MAG: Maf family protein, partial [Steroidobacteraceae bacterium]
QVLSGVAVASSRGVETRSSTSVVTFRAITAAEIAAYWASGEPRDKAGGYAVQGRAARFIARLEGSYSGVMGLPLYETAELLTSVGLLPALDAAR